MIPAFFCHFMVFFYDQQGLAIIHLKTSAASTQNTNNPFL